ncbi:MAG: hypothetical protein ACW987_00595 [Candidatus Thorarchaeota archaeon]
MAKKITPEGVKLLQKRYLEKGITKTEEEAEYIANFLNELKEDCVNLSVADLWESVEKGKLSEEDAKEVSQFILGLKDEYTN